MKTSQAMEPFATPSAILGRLNLDGRGRAMWLRLHGISFGISSDSFSRSCQQAALKPTGCREN